MTSNSADVRVNWELYIEKYRPRRSHKHTSDVFDFLSGQMCVTIEDSRSSSYSRSPFLEGKHIARARAFPFWKKNTYVARAPRKYTHTHFHFGHCDWQEEHHECEDRPREPHGFALLGHPEHGVQQLVLGENVHSAAADQPEAVGFLSAGGRDEEVCRVP